MGTKADAELFAHRLADWLADVAANDQADLSAPAGDPQREKGAAPEEHSPGAAVARPIRHDAARST
jgi:hypothetical protein